MQIHSQKIGRIGAIFCLVYQIFGASELLAQVAIIASPDSTLSEDWDHESYYALRLLRLQRWLRENTESANAVMLTEITPLIKEAEVFATEEDFYMASLWLEMIWDLIETSESPALESVADAAQVANPGMYPLAAQLRWTKAVTSGVDFWRQRFNFSFFEEDSTFREGDSNPFSALRLLASYDDNRNHFLANGYFKYSRDYLTGEANLRYTKVATNSFRWWIENRLEATSFYQDFDLKYLQNLSLLAVRLDDVGPLSLEFQDEYRIKRYADESSSYPSYHSNSFSATARADYGIANSLGVRVRTVLRKHGTFDINDYHENRVELSLAHSVVRKLSVSLIGELSDRQYPKAPVDTVFQDFRESYFSGNLRLALSPAFGFQAKSAVTKRDYDLLSAQSLPDYTYWEIAPELYFRMGSNWRISAGVMYSQELHQDLTARLNAADRLSATDRDATFGILFEDYNAYGPTLSIEFFEINGLLFSLRETYQFRRYPNSQQTDLGDFNLYTDRNLNSILLFVTWNMTSRWQLNILANMDDDRNQRDESGDSQNTLIGVEIGYSF